MKNLVLLFSAIILGTTGVLAAGTNEDKVAIRNAYRYDNSFIFVENGITFSVYPDGEFDFYIDDYVQGRNNGVTFNSGYDYSPFAQYDDYGAVIQVENVPVYYDYYGRVTQIGDVDIAYRNGRVFRMGGMYVHYNNHGYYDYHTGYINVYNRYYVYRPFHQWFVRPSIGFGLVFHTPYRRYYNPFRYTYYTPYTHNQRWGYAKVGKEYRYNKVRQERATVYRNDKRVAVRDDRNGYGNQARSNRSVGKGDYTAARGREVSRSSRDTDRKVTTARSSRSGVSTQGRSSDSRVNRGAGNTNTKDNARSTDGIKDTQRSSSLRSSEDQRNGNIRSNEGRKVTQRSSMIRSPQRNSVTKRTVSETPRSRTDTRSTKTYNKPEGRASSSRSVANAPARTGKSVSSRSSTPRKSVGRTSTQSRNTVSRSSASRGVTRKAVSSSKRSSPRSTTVRSRVRQ